MSEEYQDSGETMEAAAPLDAAVEEAQQQEQPQHVPLDALQAERAQRQRLEEQMRLMQENLELMKYQQQQPVQKQQEQDYSDDDVPTWGEVRRTINKEKQELQMTLQELRMTQKYPDYQDVITNYLPEVLKTNPSLRNTLQQSQDYELAYYLAKNSDAYKGKAKQVKKNADAERIVKNAQQAGSLSSVGQTSPISQAKRYKEMSDAEFSKLVNRNMGHF